MIQTVQSKWNIKKIWQQIRDQEEFFKRSSLFCSYVYNETMKVTKKSSGMKGGKLEMPVQ